MRLFLRWLSTDSDAATDCAWMVAFILLWLVVMPLLVHLKG